MTVAAPTPRGRLAAAAHAYLESLCERIPARHVGSRGNRDATDLVARSLRGAGFVVDAPEFDCLDWHCDAVDFRVDGRRLSVAPGPYTPGCVVEAPLRAASDVSELGRPELRGSVLVLSGAIAARQLKPKHAPYPTSGRDRFLVAALEAARPAAIVAATAHDPTLAGARSPFPLIEDGDVDIPSAYLPAGEADWLLARVGRPARLEIRAHRTPARACNVVARTGPHGGRSVLVTAHVDAKRGSPGALDNAGGVTVLLLLARLLADYRGNAAVELVALNGEDHYDNPGERHFLERNRARLRDIVLAINIDGVGYRLGGTAFSLYGASPALETLVSETLAGADGLARGEPWYQGDHGLFLLEGIPALALTSERVRELTASVMHTARDTPDLVDPDRLAGLATALSALIARLGRAA